MTVVRRIIVNTISFVALTGLLQSTHIFYVSSLWYALSAAIVLGLLNAFVAPVLILVSLPITIITLGLFGVVINAFMLELTSYVVGTQNFHFANFWVNIMMVVIMSIINAVVSNYFTRANANDEEN